jgi:hypothetical protein
LKSSRAGLLALLALVSCAPEPAPRSPARSAATPAPAIPGVSIRKVERRDLVPLVVHVVAIDLAKAPGVLKVVAERGPDGLVTATVSRLAALNGLFLAVNASFFQLPAGKYPAAGERADAVGGLLLDGESVAPKGPGLGLINAGLCMDGRNVRVEKGFACKGARYGLASGPLLLWHGEAVDTAFADKIFKSLRHPRTAVGVDSTRQKVWFLVADGRQPGVSEGATLDELKQMLKGEGATDALNLDGGGSSTLVKRQPDGSYKVLNIPIHERIPGRERPVVSAVGVAQGPLTSF